MRIKYWLLSYEIKMKRNWYFYELHIRHVYHRLEDRSAMSIFTSAESSFVFNSNDSISDLSWSHHDIIHTTDGGIWIRTGSSITRALQAITIGDQHYTTPNTCTDGVYQYQVRKKKSVAQKSVVLSCSSIYRGAADDQLYRANRISWSLISINTHYWVLQLLSIYSVYTHSYRTNVITKVQKHNRTRQNRTEY